MIRQIRNICLDTKFITYGKLFLLTVIFGLSYTQAPLYTSNQNTYFLHGLAEGGLGFLIQDWMAKTADAFPVFSFLVSLTYSYLPQVFFYLYYYILIGIYIYSIIGIVLKVWEADVQKSEYLTYFIFIVAIHSAVFITLSSRLLGINLRDIFVDGLARQYLLGPVFQPSMFGVFLLLSIYSFICNKPFMAVVYSSIAVIFHMSYLLSALFLTVAYMSFIIIKEKNVKKSILLGIISLLLVAPVLFYSYSNFSATSPDILKQAKNILFNYRIPHHANPGHWFDLLSIVQILIVFIALLLIRRKQLFFLLIIPVLAGIILTLLQYFTGNYFLALLFPWRISAFLVPLSTCLLGGWIIFNPYRIFDQWIKHYKRGIHLMLLLILLLIFLYGGYATYYRFNQFFTGEDVLLTDYVAKTSKADDLYLIPPELENFRLRTGTPVFVDEKTHPYKDIEIIHWYDRIQIADKFYNGDTEGKCAILQQIINTYSVSHVVIQNKIQKIDCNFILPVYKDKRFMVYKIMTDN
jgi:hypothetical protein